MEDPFFTATTDLDKILDDFEESETVAVIPNPASVKKKKNDLSVQPKTNQAKHVNNFSEIPSDQSETKHQPIAADVNEAPTFSQSNADMLIDFSSPASPMQATTQPSEVNPNTIKELDFLLSFAPVTTNPVEKPIIKENSSAPTNLLDLDIGQDFQQPEITIQDSDGSQLNNIQKDTSSLLNASSKLQSNIVKQNSNHGVPSASLNEVVGFEENVHVDDSEFQQFMEESVSGLERLSENNIESQASKLSSSTVDGPILKTNSSSLPSHNDGLLDEMASTTNKTDKIVTTSQNSSPQSSSQIVENTSTSSQTQPRLKKIFHKDIVASRSSPYVPSSQEIVGCAQPTINHSSTPTNSELMIEESTTDPDEPTSDTLSQHHNHSQRSDARTPISASNSTSTAAHVSILQRDEVPPSSLPADLHQRRERQRFPSVSPPSYSSVIAGDYSAGTLVEEDPARAFAANSSESIMQHHNNYSTPMASAARDQPRDEEAIEHGIEATEDSAESIQDNQRLPTNRASALQVVAPNVLQRPGQTKPLWVPDGESPACTKCQAKFTFRKRRHHCRACGRVFCSSCCGEKSKLAYLDYAEARVCILCYTAIVHADAVASGAFPLNTGTTSTPTSEPAQPINPSSSATSNPRPVLRNGDVPEASESNSSKSVRFFDGTRPDHPAVLPDTPPLPARRAIRVNQRSGTSSAPRSLLPPVVVEYHEDGSYAVDDDPDPAFVLTLLKSDPDNPVRFVLSANLFVLLKQVDYDSIPCYYFVSLGLDSVGQSEVALLLQIDPANEAIPIHAFSLYSHLFHSGRKGKAVHANDFVLTKDFLESSETVFGSSDYAGLLFVRRTCQSVLNLDVSTATQAEHSSMSSSTVHFSATLFALLVRKEEVQWANLFCSRLLLRLGAKYKQFPCPLVNICNRPPVYYEVGNTILGILCDFRNYKYRVVSVSGISVVASKGGVVISIPCNRFADITKIMNSSNEHVIALGSDTFLSDDTCTSHLVCIQNEQTHEYRTEVMTSQSQEAELDSCAGAAFIVFNGSLKSGNTQHAKCTIVEDGVMVQLHPEKMSILKDSLKAMEDFKLNCEQPSQNEASGEAEMNENSSDAVEDASHFVEVRWVSDDTKFNIGLSSPIDFKSFEGVVGYNVQGKSEKKGKNQVLRWNQVFFFKSTSDILDMSRLAERVANGCFKSLIPHVKLLRDSGQKKIGIRFNIHPDDVGYAVGSHGMPLPDACLNALDDNLIPVIHEASSSLQADDDPVMFELIFSVLEIRTSWKAPNK